MMVADLPAPLFRSGPTIVWRGVESCPVLPLATFSSSLLGLLIAFLSLFLILLVLLQRGRGGGLSGALGGPGGQSAFGSKAGDTFTIITVVTASIWAFVCAFTMWLLGGRPTDLDSLPDPTLVAGPADDGLSGLEGLSIPEVDEQSDTFGDLIPATPADATPKAVPPTTVTEPATAATEPATTVATPPKAPAETPATETPSTEVVEEISPQGSDS